MLPDWITKHFGQGVGCNKQPIVASATREDKMGRQKLKGRALNKILSGDHWYRIEEKPMPLLTDIANAVRTHNANYVTTGVGAATGNGQAATQPLSQRPLITPSYYTPKPDHDWTCTVADTVGCPIATAQVEMPVEMYQACTELAGEFATEWIAFLKGDLNQAGGRARITSMYFPPQSASGAHVEVPDETFRPEPGTIGAIHSHNTMGAFWSKTDEDHANWPIEIVINAKGESKMRMRVKLECGRWSRIDGKIVLTGIKAADAYRENLKAALKPVGDHATYGQLAQDAQGFVKVVHEGTSMEGYEIEGIDYVPSQFHAGSKGRM